MGWAQLMLLLLWILSTTVKQSVESCRAEKNFRENVGENCDTARGLRLRASG